MLSEIPQIENEFNNLTALPILYSFRRCPYAMRARLALASSGIEVELREVVLRDKPEQLLQLSPKGTVPVLVAADRRIVEESLDIRFWALEQNDPEHWLASEKKEQQEMLDLINRCETEFKTHLDRYKYANRYEDVDGEGERDKAGLYLQELDKRLTKGSYLFGDQITLADMAIVTFVRQLANVDRVWFDGQGWVNLIRWLESFLSSDRFTAIMDKYARWEEGDEITRLN